MKHLLIISIFALSLIQKVSGQPVGSVVAYAGEIAVAESDSTYMNCDGRLLKIKDFPKLFKAIGWNYLTATDSINKKYFRLPNYQGYFLRGVDTLGQVDKDKYERTNLNGENIGPLVGSMQKDSFKLHHHNINDPGHNHGMRDDNLSGGRENFSGAEVTMYPAGQNAKPNTTTGITIVDEGGNETRPINIAVYWIIKVR